MVEYFRQNEKVRLMVLEQDDSVMHSHDFLEMVYVTRGRALHTLNDMNTIVQKGDYFIVDYGARHRYKKADKNKFEIINILFKPEIIDKALTDCNSFQDLINNYLIRFSYKTLEYSPTNVIFHDDGGFIYTMIEKLQCEYEKKSPGYIELMRCYIIEIIIKTMRRISKEEKDEPYSENSKYIINYIDENYMKPVTLTDISASLNYSLPYVCKMFKKDVGMHFNEYLQKKRIEQSCRLISNTEKRISEIAGLVGYSDIKFFNQVFKKHLKMTPSQFKKIHS